MIINIQNKINTKSIKHLDGIVLSGSNFYPPHIGLLVKGKYYSCSAYAVKKAIPFNRAFKKFQIKNFKVLIAELHFSPSNFKADHFFTNHGVLEGSKTCLSPVKKTIEDYLSLSFDANFIYEFLPILEKLKLINVYSHHGLDEEITNEKYELKTYSKQDILSCIKDLQLSNVK